MTLLVGPALRALFHTFEHTAFRLEVRESYYERDQLAQFVAGEPVDLSNMDEWLGLMVRLRTEGKRVERVRVVSKPYSDYTRFGLWLCQYNTGAGENIRYLERSQAQGLPNHDYWLFDSTRLYALRFGDDDELLGAERIEDTSEILQHGYWRDAAWHRAVPYPEYVKTASLDLQHPPSS